jgi:ubiquinone/menaquinone biosynthesis C-methylase UbiE
MQENHPSQKEIYDRSWSASLSTGKEQQGNLSATLCFLEKTGLILPGLDILEVGCGIGSVVYELSKKGCRAVGTDISSEAIAYGCRKYPGIDLRVQPGETLDFDDESFDRVLSFDFIEHIARVDDHIAEIRRVLRSGGYYLFGTPNKYIDAVYETMRYRNLRWRSHHPSLHSQRDIRTRMAKHGFSCRFVKVNTLTDFLIRKIASSVFLQKFLQHIDISRLPICLQTNFYVVAAKRDS